MGKKKLGRPKSSEDTSQKYCVSVWLRADEKADVAMAADAARLPTSTWAGKVLVEAAKRALTAMGL